MQYLPVCWLSPKKLAALQIAISLGLPFSIDRPPEARSPIATSGFLAHPLFCS